jgi:hypothetical protein
MFRCCSLILALTFALCAWAQDEPSLADAARKARQGKAAPAKRVVTEETLDQQQGPLPALHVEGPDNAADVIKAIGDYKNSHTSQETELVVREWYHRYDDLLQHASNQNAEIKARQKDKLMQPPEYPQDDYKKYQEQRLAEIRAAAQDEKLTKENGLLCGRIQGAFYKIRTELKNKYRLDYEWLKPSSQYW